VREWGYGFPRRGAILVAEDDPDILELLCAMLEQAGYTALAACDGVEALDLARSHLPKACVLDIVMSRLGGLEVVRELRNDKTMARVPVLMLSAHVHDFDSDTVLSAGATEHMTKPFDGSELLSRLAKMLDGI
jgi:DNA-binding response OmpR family regulator